jgi:hypothetical protein
VTQAYYLSGDVVETVANQSEFTNLFRCSIVEELFRYIFIPVKDEGY